MRTLVLLALAAAPLASLAAQQPAPGADRDPTVRAAGGTLPSGWQLRLDDKDTARFSSSDVKLARMGAGYHVTSGPAAIYYNPADAARGAFTARATFTQTKAPTHPEAYGLLVGGQHLGDSTQSYMYFLVRGDGRFLVNHRAGRDVHKIVPWTESAALHKADAQGRATNQLAVVVKPDSVLFLANGTQVVGFSKADMHGGNLDGQVGIRVNHNLDVHVADFAVVPAKR